VLNAYQARDNSPADMTREQVAAKIEELKIR
jgi:hypothetical protein